MNERWQQIQDLFDEVVELDPGACQARLEAVRQGDPELCRRVQSLLAAYARRDDVLGLFEEPKEPLPGFVGRQVDRYRILKPLGRGGMGSVFLAQRDDQHFKGLAAIKLIRRGMDTEDILRRFRNERQILAALNHPGIARLLDGGMTEEGLPYFVMEYIDGAPLDHYCDQHRLSISERLDLFMGVCEAVQYAHQNLVVHRDLKPSNILVTTDGQVKLLDFGIAKVLNPVMSAVSMAVTRTELRVMTPAYASPEQILGEKITTASDVYALGVLLYELLTGHQPHRLGGQLEPELVRIILEAEPAKPSMVVTQVEEIQGRDGATSTITPEQVSARRSSEIKQLKRRLRGDLDNIVLKALRKEPSQRYASAEQLGADVQRFLFGSPILARKATAGYRLRKFVLRHRVSVAAATLVVLSLVAGLGAALWQAQVAQHERDVAQQEAEKLAQVTEFVVSVFEISNASESRGDTLTALEVLERGAAWVESEMMEDSEIKAAMMDVLGRIYQNLGRFDDATPFLERALALRRQVHGGTHPEVARSLHHLGSLHQMKGDYEAAEQLLQEALAMQQTLWQGDHPDIANTLTHLSYLTGELSDDPSTKRLRRESLAMRRRLWGDEHPAVAQALNDLASHLSGKEIYNAEAEALHREALAIRRKVIGPKTMPVAISLSNLGIVLQNKGDFETAERLQRESVAIRKAIVGETHPTLAIGLGKLAFVLLRKGAYEEAAEQYREALRIYRIVYPKGNLRIARVLTEWGEIHIAQGRTKEAEAMLREALDFYMGHYGDQHWRTAWAKSLLGACLTQQARYAEAEPMLQDALPHLRDVYGPTHLLTRKTHQHLADLYEAWGKPEQAKAYRGEAGP